MANIIETIKDMPTKNMITLLVLLTLAITSVILLFSWIQKADYQLLYSNLSEEDAGLIIQKLNEMKIPYKASAGGISVPSDKVYELRLQLASHGLPQGGAVGFELFDKTNFAMTDFVQKLNYRRALQGELTRTIRSLSEVEQCRVHLAVPEKTLFSQGEDRPKASVLVKLKPGKRLTDNQVHGIVHLIASSVEGLDPKDVAIVDSRGEMLTTSIRENIGMTGSQMEYQKNYEKDVEEKIVSILEPVVGKGKVKARVAANIDFTKIEKTEERFDPDSQVIRSEQKNTEKSTTGITGGVPGVASNLPGKAVQQTAFSQGHSERRNEIINYEISKITSRIMNSSGEIKRLSAVVLVDGTYAVQEGSNEKKYVPRTEEEIKKLEEMVKKAIGFAAERGDEISVVNMPFEVVPHEELPEQKKEIMPVVTTGIKYFIPVLGLIFMFFFVIKPLMKILTAPQTMQRSSSMPLPQTVSEIDRSMELEKKGARENVVEWAKKNPREAGNIIRGWIEEK